MIEVVTGRDPRCSQLADLLFPGKHSVISLKLLIDAFTAARFEAEIYAVDCDGKMVPCKFDNFGTTVLTRDLTSDELDKLLEMFK